MNYFLEQFILHVNNLLNIAVKRSDDFLLDSNKGRGWGGILDGKCLYMGIFPWGTFLPFLNKTFEVWFPYDYYNHCDS